MACLLYATDEDEQELAAFGFLPSDYETAEPLLIWPENQKAVSLFSSISTQWRTGAFGPTGLDYNVLFTRMERMHLTDAAHDHLFGDVRVIEFEALRILNTKS